MSTDQVWLVHKEGYSLCCLQGQAVEGRVKVKTEAGEVLEVAEEDIEKVFCVVVWCCRCYGCCCLVWLFGMFVVIVLLTKGLSTHSSTPHPPFLLHLRRVQASSTTWRMCQACATSTSAVFCTHCATATTATSATPTLAFLFSP